MQIKCEECKFWINEAECHLHPPSPDRPKTKGDDSCGDGEQKDRTPQIFFL